MFDNFFLHISHTFWFSQKHPNFDVIWPNPLGVFLVSEPTSKITGCYVLTILCFTVLLTLMNFIIKILSFGNNLPGKLMTNDKDISLQNFLHKFVCKIMSVKQITRSYFLHFLGALKFCLNFPLFCGFRQ